MSWIEPLSLETWFVGIFAGTPEIFLILALLTISAMAGFFRMSNVALFFMLGIFMLMFTQFISSPLVILLVIIGGVVIGMILSKFYAN